MHAYQAINNSLKNNSVYLSMKTKIEEATSLGKYEIVFSVCKSDFADAKRACRHLVDIERYSIEIEYLEAIYNITISW